jgi:hypothetical protein
VWAKAVVDAAMKGTSSKQLDALNAQLDFVFSSSFKSKGVIVPALPPPGERQALLEKYLKEMSEAKD